MLAQLTTTLMLMVKTTSPKDDNGDRYALEVGAMLLPLILMICWLYKCC